MSSSLLGSRDEVVATVQAPGRGAAQALRVIAVAEIVAGVLFFVMLGFSSDIGDRVWGAMLLAVAVCGAPILYGLASICENVAALRERRAPEN